MSNVVYVSDSNGFKIRHNDVDKKSIVLDGRKYANGEVIVQFNPFRSFSEERNAMMMKGFLMLDAEKDKEKIAWLESYPDYNHGFKKEPTGKVPERFSGSGIITGAVASPPIKDEDDKIVKQAIKEAGINEGIKKGIRYQELKQKYFKIDGELKANVDKEDAEVAAELTEFETLKKELNL